MSSHRGVFETNNPSINTDTDTYINHPNPILHTTTTQTATLTNSLLTAPFNPQTLPTNPFNPHPQSQQPPPAHPSNLHPCPWQGCSRTFRCPHNVRQHIREKHTFERPYACQTCAADGLESAFARQYGLNRHLAQVHGLGGRQRRAKGGEERAEAGARFDGVVGAGVGVEGVEGGAGAGFFGNEFGMEGGLGVDIGDLEGEFAQTATLLAGANAQMMDSSLNGGDFEMSDVQFHPGTNQEPGSVSSSYDSEAAAAAAFYCGACGSTVTTSTASAAAAAAALTAQQDLQAHMHAIHQTPKSRLCSCNECRAFFFPREEDAIAHAANLHGGGFLVLRDGVFAAAASGVAGVASFAAAAAAMSPFSHHRTAKTGGGPDFQLDFADAATIDPYLLSV